MAVPGGRDLAVPGVRDLAEAERRGGGGELLENVQTRVKQGRTNNGRKTVENWSNKSNNGQIMVEWWLSSNTGRLVRMVNQGHTPLT